MWLLWFSLLPLGLLSCFHPFELVPRPRALEGKDVGDSHLLPEGLEPRAPGQGEGRLGGPGCLQHGLPCAQVQGWPGKPIPTHGAEELGAPKGGTPTPRPWKTAGSSRAAPLGGRLWLLPRDLSLLAPCPCRPAPGPGRCGFEHCCSSFHPVHQKSLVSRQAENSFPSLATTEFEHVLFYHRRKN